MHEAEAGGISSRSGYEVAARQKGGRYGIRVLLSCLLSLVMGLAGVPAGALAESLPRGEAETVLDAPEDGGDAEGAGGSLDGEGMAAHDEAEGAQDSEGAEAPAPGGADGQAPEGVPETSLTEVGHESPATDERGEALDNGEDDGETEGAEQPATGDASDVRQDSQDDGMEDPNSNDAGNQRGEEEQGAPTDDVFETGGLSSDVPDDSGSTGDAQEPEDAPCDNTSKKAPPSESETDGTPGDESQDLAYTDRLIVRLDDGSHARACDDVLGVMGDERGQVALLGFADARARDEAVDYYERYASWVALDCTLLASRGGVGDSVMYTGDNNPIDALREVSVPETSEGVCIALLDSGVPVGEDASNATSFVDDDVLDRSGHATEVLAALKEQNTQAQVCFVKVLDDEGRGTASSVYAGIIHAVDAGCALINLSLAGADVEGNAAIREAVQYALDHGVVVVAAAGNGGHDADLVTPANIAGVLTVGAAKDGIILETSNRGECVDLYVEAPSTSVAAAKASGWLSAHLSSRWYEDIVGSELNARVETQGPSESADDPWTPDEGVIPAADVRIYWKLESGVLHISSSELDESYNGPVFPFEFEEQSAPWYGLRRSITRVVVDNAVSPTTCAHWFYDCSNLVSVDLSRLNMAEVMSTANMFYNCRSLTALDVADWDMGKCVDFFQMFYNCRSLTALAVSDWDMSSAEDLRSLFDTCTGLTHMDVSSWNTARVTTMKNLFKDCTGLVACDVGGLDTSHVLDMTYMFYNCPGITTLDVSDWDVSNVESMHFIFAKCGNLDSLDVSRWNVGHVRFMSNMFNNCVSLSSLDVSGWDVSSVETFNNTFNGCRALESLDVSSWNTTNAVDMHGMFANTPHLDGLDVSRFDTSNVRDMSSMFGGCASLSALDVSRWNTSRVETFNRMFKNCPALKELDLTSFDTSAATDIGSMFAGCSGITALDLSNFNTAAVTSMSCVFDGCVALESLDIGFFDARMATDMGRMFANCDALCSVTLGKNFSFRGAGITDEGKQAMLPTPPSNKPFSGRWANSSVEGCPSASAEDLRGNYEGSPDGGAYGPGTFVWERLVTYHFDPNAEDAQGSADDVLVGPGGEVRVPEAVFTRALFDQVSWNSAPDGTGTYYVPGSSFTNEVDPYGDVTEVTIYAVWEAKQMSVRVPVAIHYVADQDGTMAGPDDDVATIRNTGETDVALDGIRAESYEPWSFVAEGNDLAASQMSLGMRLGDSGRLDFHALDGTTQLYARIVPSATLGLRDLRGAAGPGLTWDEFELGCLHWHFRAVA